MTGMQPIWGPVVFLEVSLLFLPLESFFSNQLVSFCSSIYIEDSPKLPWGMQRICGPFVLKTIIMNIFAFRETFCPVPLDH